MTTLLVGNGAGTTKLDRVKRMGGIIPDSAILATSATDGCELSAFDSGQECPGNDGPAYLRASTALAARLNPRSLRTALAITEGPLSREAVDRIAGASNGPAVIMVLRRRWGLSLPCHREAKLDSDGRQTARGVYSATTSDIQLIEMTLARLEKEVLGARSSDFEGELLSSSPDDLGWTAQLLQARTSAWLRASGDYPAALVWVDACLDERRAATLLVVDPEQRENFYEGMVSGFAAWRATNQPEAA